MDLGPVLIRVLCKFPSGGSEIYIISRGVRLLQHVNFLASCLDAIFMFIWITLIFKVMTFKVTKYR